MVKKGKHKEEPDDSTEEKIKAAARKIFTQKGYAGTTTRDIVAEAGINLALLNYYFRSKEKLFHIIMIEELRHFLHGMGHIFNNEHSSLEEKIEGFVSNYIDLLIEHPDLPLFLFSEIRTNAAGLVANVGFKETLLTSYFYKQLQEEMESGNIAKTHPLQVMMNTVSLTVFPFVTSPMLKQMGDLNQDDFVAMMLERKRMIPLWIKAMLKTA